MPDNNPERQSKSVSRRSFVSSAGGAALLASTGIAGGVVGAVAGVAAAPYLPPTLSSPQGSARSSRAPQDFYGPHQAGVDADPQAHAVFVAYDMKPGEHRDRFIVLMKLLTDDASRLTQGRPALPDNDPELAHDPAGLTITFGFGRSLFDSLGVSTRIPPGFVDIPQLAADRLDPAFCGGDILVQLCSDDPLTVAHAVRQLTRTAMDFATVRWTQRGFIGEAGRSSETGTPRNLMGMLDGTVNPGRFGMSFDEHVWATDAGWFTGGTMLVIRRIAMKLPEWDKLNESDKERVIGRKVASGAPLGGTRESDTPDLEAVSVRRVAVIDPAAHIRRAAPTNPHERFLRRPYSYDLGILEDGDPDSGLIFAAYAANIETQYLPVQQRVAEKDLLNIWTTTVGSATFVIPPGTVPGGYVGDGLVA